MATDLAQIQAWLIEEWTSRLAAAVEAMAGERPATSSNALAAGPDPEEGAVRWRQPFPPLAGAMWVVASAGATATFGAHVLRASGVEDSTRADQRSTFLEILNHALKSLAQSVTARLTQEVNCSGGAESSDQPDPASWTAVGLSLAGATSADTPGDSSVTLTIGIETALAEAIRAAESSSAAPLEPDAPSPAHSPADNSRNFELLLDVELPVAISFGRAQIPLKDVLKLTTGSIVELDRTVTEPVEIIVNNCVIARGEVVVVDGNFGVRVQEVMNRQERLKTVQ
jgi:flagellar motor switch protein FliN/FliY